MIEACRKLKWKSALIDGGAIGLSDCAALRAAIEGAPYRLLMFAFDLLFLAGEDCWCGEIDGPGIGESAARPCATSKERGLLI